MIIGHILTFLVLLAVSSQHSAEVQQQPPSAAVPSIHFDASHDASLDISSALLEARRTNRRVLIEVGGEWCPYCLEMDALFRANKDLLALRDEHFIVVPVYYDDVHKNEKALAGYPPIQGIPHIYVLDQQGNVLHSQHVVELREHGAYSPAKVRTFLEQWSSTPGKQVGPPQPDARGDQP